jgi:hypothetical protein
MLCGEEFKRFLKHIFVTWRRRAVNSPRPASAVAGRSTTERHAGPSVWASVWAADWAASQTDGAEVVTVESSGSKAHHESAGACQTRRPSDGDGPGAGSPGSVSPPVHCQSLCRPQGANAPAPCPAPPAITRGPSCGNNVQPNRAQNKTMQSVWSLLRENGQMSYLQRSFSAEMVRSSHKIVFSSVLQWFISSHPVQNNSCKDLLLGLNKH